MAYDEETPLPDGASCQDNSAGGMNQGRRILIGHELEEARKWMGYIADKVAIKSACTRSKRGAIIVKYGKIMGEGTNGACPEFRGYCDPCMRIKLDVPSKTRYELCSGKHAERDALENAIRNMLRLGPEERSWFNLGDARMYHLALDDSGKPKPSGDPSCTLCSGPILEWGIADVVLWHGGDNYEAYDARTFHKLSLRNMIKESGLDKDGLYSL